MQPPAELNLPWRCGCQSENRIVLVGATVRAAAQSAARAGFCVTGLDRFGDADTLQACHRHFVINGGNDELDRLASQCAGIRVMQVGGLISHQGLIRRLEQVSPLLGPSPSVCDRLRDEAGLRSLARQAGICFPATLESPSATSGQSLKGGNGWLCKQRASCGGLGVRWFVDRRDTDHNERIQQWIPGRSFGATLLSDGKEVRLLGVCRSLFTRHPDRPFVYAGSLGPIPILPSTTDSLRRLGRCVVEATGLRGLWNVDYLLDADERVWLLEINPRWSGSSELIERGLLDLQQLESTESLLGLAVAACERNESQSVAEPDPIDGTQPSDNESAAQAAMYLKRIVFAPVDMRLDRSSIDGLVGSNACYHDVPADGTVIRRREPVMTVITKIDRTADQPMRSHRVMLSKLRETMRRCR
jgi:predicted ATP-grasp superfamily ATP-dependent carboligase